MQNFIQDVIHLTKWEFIIRYWWLELMVIAIVIGYVIFDNMYKK